jgi:chromosome segregation ATPase
MWAIAAVGAVIVAFLLRPKTKAAPAKISAPTAAAIGLSNDQIRAFVEAYEEKMQITNEIRSLEVRVQRGRIPRRRYKERRTSLEGRLDALNKTIVRLKEVIRRSGGSHADVMRQLDAAEIKLNEANQDLTTLEARRNVGEVSIEDYKRQLTDVERRKQKAEGTINGLLLRLRGEIS